MTDTKPTEKSVEKKKEVTKLKGKFTIMDLLMVIMVVGIFFTLTLSVLQTKKYEAIVRESVDDIITILLAMENFRVTEGWDAFDIDQLNLRNFKSKDFVYTLTDTAVVATTNNLVAEEKTYFYDLREHRFRVSQNSRDIIEDSWLP